MSRETKVTRDKIKSNPFISTVVEEGPPAKKLPGPRSDEVRGPGKVPGKQTKCSCRE